MPRVTVIIPSHGHADYVGEAIQSVWEQAHADVELIVIDDGSPDDSVARIEALLDGGRDGTTFLQQENRGLVATLARGLELATGAYVCELASDDALTPASLAERVALLESHADHVGVFTDAWWIRDAGRTQERVLDPKRRALFEAVDPVPTMIGGVLPVFATGLFRTEALRACGGFDAETFRYYEDLDTPIRLALHGRLATIDKPLFFRREHATNVSTVTSHVQREKALLYEKLLTLPGCAPYERQVRRRLYRAYLALGQHIGRSTEPDPRDLEVFRRAWRIGKRHPRLLWHLLRHGRAPASGASA